MKHFLILFVFGISAAFAQVTGKMNYQGQLLQDNGIPATGIVDIQIRIFGSATGGSSLRNETFSDVTLDDQGLFSVSLGTSGPPLGDVFDGSGDRFIEVRQRPTGGTFAVVGPRQQVLSSPFALVAETALNVQSVGGPLSEIPGDAFDVDYFEFCIGAGSSVASDSNNAGAGPDGGNCNPGDRGFMIEAEMRTPAVRWEEAVLACAASGRRLISHFEYRIACEQDVVPSLDTSGGSKLWEWVKDEPVIVGERDCDSAANAYDVSGTDFVHQFRCAQ